MRLEQSSPEQYMRLAKIRHRPDRDDEPPPPMTPSVSVRIQISGNCEEPEYRGLPGRGNAQASRSTCPAGVFPINVVAEDAT
jgi:hypothetical protein